MDSESACKSALHVARKNFNEHQEVHNCGYLRRKAQLDENPDGLKEWKLPLRTGFPLPEKSKTAGTKMQKTSCEDNPVIPLLDDSDVKLVFPLPRSVQFQQLGNHGFLRQSSQLLTEIPSAAKSKSTVSNSRQCSEIPSAAKSKSTVSNSRQCSEILSAAKSKSAVSNSRQRSRKEKLATQLFQGFSAEQMFPEFFPRGQMFSYHADLKPLDAQTDPILWSWMLFFGRQTTK